jgi:hypothetical protein
MTYSTLNFQTREYDRNYGNTAAFFHLANLGIGLFF